MITIKETKEFREKFNLTHIVILGISEDGSQHVSTHGKTESNAKEAAKLGNELKEKLNWPKNLCNSKPLSRICENCSFYKYPSHRDITYGDEGKCMVEPKQITRNRNAIACKFFEPKY